LSSIGSPSPLFFREPFLSSNLGLTFCFLQLFDQRRSIVLDRFHDLPDVLRQLSRLGLLEPP
jgi:hypothetical protein